MKPTGRDLLAQVLSRVTSMRSVPGLRTSARRPMLVGDALYVNEGGSWLTFAVWEQGDRVYYHAAFPVEAVVTRPDGSALTFVDGSLPLDEVIRPDLPDPSFDDGTS